MLKLSSSLTARADTARLVSLVQRSAATFSIANTGSERGARRPRSRVIASNEDWTRCKAFSTTCSLKSNKEWTKILTQAEKIVGYPTSFLNLRYLVSDEMANFTDLLRKLMKTKHPLIDMVRRLIMTGADNESKKSLQINGIIVLLIAKAAGVPRRNTQFLDSEISDGILNSQRCLAEITEMIYMGSLIHKGMSLCCTFFQEA
jgi:hypothetical protein